MRIIYILIIATIICSCATAPKEWIDKNVKPDIYPDYSNVVFPANIAPPVFRIMGEAQSYYVEFRIKGELIFSVSTDSQVAITPSDWKQIPDGEFEIITFAKQDEGWVRYQPIVNQKSEYDIDQYIVYRLIAPGYELWRDMGIYQRDLSTYDEQPILTNTATETGCMNCHSFARANADTMMLHLRGKIAGTLLKTGDRIEKVSLRNGDMISEGVYPSWHPSARFIAYSVNETSQFFHLWGDKPIEVSDAKSDLVIYDVDRNEIVTSDLIYGDSHMETFPEWSSDGRKLYFTRADSLTIGGRIDTIRYDLCSIDFDSEKRTFSNLQILFKASEVGKSVSFPKVIPGSDKLVFTLSDYGNFSIWHPESDLYMIDLKSLTVENAEKLNSDKADSFHSFSSDGNWIVISSRRDDGLYTRPYIAYYDRQLGQFSKPFLVPQKSADFYDNTFMSYNLSQFTRNQFRGQRQMLDAALGSATKRATSAH